MVASPPTSNEQESPDKQQAQVIENGTVDRRALAERYAHALARDDDGDSVIDPTYISGAIHLIGISIWWRADPLQHVLLCPACVFPLFLLGHAQFEMEDACSDNLFLGQTCY